MGTLFLLNKTTVHRLTFKTRLSKSLFRLLVARPIGVKKLLAWLYQPRKVLKIENIYIVICNSPQVYLGVYANCNLSLLAIRPISDYDYNWVAI